MKQQHIKSPFASRAMAPTPVSLSLWRDAVGVEAPFQGANTETDGKRTWKLHMHPWKRRLENHHSWNAWTGPFFCFAWSGGRKATFTPAFHESFEHDVSPFSAEAPSKLAVSVPFRAVSDEMFLLTPSLCLGNRSWQHQSKMVALRHPFCRCGKLMKHKVWAANTNTTCTYNARIQQNYHHRAMF